MNILIQNILSFRIMIYHFYYGSAENFAKLIEILTMLQRSWRYLCLTCPPGSQNLESSVAPPIYFSIVVEGEESEKHFITNELCKYCRKHCCGSFIAISTTFIEKINLLTEVSVNTSVTLVKQWMKEKNTKIRKERLIGNCVERKCFESIFDVQSQKGK